MHVSHILRKYDPNEWGGTETAVLRLLQGLRSHGVQSVVHCPSIKAEPSHDPFKQAGAEVQRFQSFIPVIGIGPDQREQLVRWGGNVMSFQLGWQLLNGPLDLIHTHALNRIAGVGLMAARLRRVPFVATIHGGALDLPSEVNQQLTAPLRGGLEWGKALGLLVKSRQVLQKADAILTCNSREASLLARRYPRQRVIVQPHSVPAKHYARSRTDFALEAFPEARNRTVLLCVARLDPVKNQRWLVEQLPAMIQRHPEALLVLAGPATSNGYVEEVQSTIERLGLQNHVLLTGGLEQGGDHLIGLMQLAKAMLLPSTSETFGLAILEAWAAGAPVISSRTSGACSIITHRKSGWLFDLQEPDEFHAMLDEVLSSEMHREEVIAEATSLVHRTYDVSAAAARVTGLYEELCAAKERRVAA